VVENCPREKRANRAELKLSATPECISQIARDLTMAFVMYAGGRGSWERSERPGETKEWANRVVAAADEILLLLNADYRGPENDLPPRVPVQNRLTDYPPFSPPTGYKSAAELGDAARASMLAEVGASLSNPSIFGAHDVARVVVAGIRQLRALAVATAEDSVVQKRHAIRRTDWPTNALFRSFAEAYIALHGRRYTVTNTVKSSEGGTRRSERQSVAVGPSIVWTRRLLHIAAARAANTPLGDALNQLERRYRERTDGVAKLIRAAGRSQRPMHKGFKEPKI
jgi:hypothetical protein